MKNIFSHLHFNIKHKHIFNVWFLQNIKKRTVMRVKDAVAKLCSEQVESFNSIVFLQDFIPSIKSLSK